MTSTIAQLQQENTRQIAAAAVFGDAAREFARAANGMNGNVLPAPAAYEIFGHLKVALYDLIEVAAWLPNGLTASLTDVRINVRDSDITTGERRNPAQSVDRAAKELTELAESLFGALEHTMNAQDAINGQGYTPVEAPGEEADIEESYSQLSTSEILEWFQAHPNGRAAS